MRDNHEYIFKIANHDHEFNQIHRLNYETFVEEIPQHQRNQEGILVDLFHHENTYLICIKNKKIIGMIAVRNKRPFSLDKKIGRVEDSLPVKFESLCEIRLLSVQKEYRKGRVFLGLAQLLSTYCLQKGYDAAVISGTIREAKLYKHLGFKPFAGLTGREDALFQPMYLDKATFEEILGEKFTRNFISFLPGPVAVSDTVSQAMGQLSISHRSKAFQSILDQVKTILCHMTNSKFVQVLMGTGTLANDVIGGQLSLLDGKGLILVNGEFGKRLQEQGDRWGLNYGLLEKEWGQPFSEEEIRHHISGDTKWIWAVHSETSTGMLNDMEMLKRIGRELQLKLCMDCISSIGAVPLDLDEVYLASGVSGKAIGSYTGLSFVFHNHIVYTNKRIPKYLDLGIYQENESIPFSHSSNLVEALLVALNSMNVDKYTRVVNMYKEVRQAIESIGLEVISVEMHSSPVIMTIELPLSLSSITIGKSLKFQGYQLHYESAYLLEKNWLQIACIGELDANHVTKMIVLLKQVIDYESSLTNY
ncbi:aminotransferase class V-fold PLP-dependent enzyme [Peribacillus alkalitolerans]|uniref:aminotransferase class V-fold PLP-dependent enzyme n=1 Tax=Peribacillus alkalitolerans TaxID=1550385 RepID=UPI0013D1C6AF|nr:aminotransferase class V-fold PLP-dependent enzyme [Peribacillus alkalitolerans]